MNVLLYVLLAIELSSNIPCQTFCGTLEKPRKLCSQTNVLIGYSVLDSKYPSLLAACVFGVNIKRF